MGGSYLTFNRQEFVNECKLTMLKVRRKKKARDCFSYFKINHGFHKPYQILIDATFCIGCVKCGVTVKEWIPHYFQCEVKLLTTFSVIKEVQALVSGNIPGMERVLMIIKDFPVHQCGHDKQPQPASTCIKSMIGKLNTHRYVVATQDMELRSSLRKIPGVPILHTSSTVPMLEDPSYASERYVQQQADQRVNLSTEEASTLKKLKLRENIQEPQPLHESKHKFNKKRKRRKRRK